MGRGTVEVNLDGLVGSTHHFINTAPGNVASARGRGEVSNPRAAALQGIAKMRVLSEMGVMQSVLPPQPRPNIDWLHSMGFEGDASAVLHRAYREAPGLLAAASSSSFMWAANAATVSPSSDTADGRLHLTPANLVSSLHRSHEARFTTLALRSVLADEKFFKVHAPLPSCRDLADEGAANHTRLCSDVSDPGVALFVYGLDTRRRTVDEPGVYPARQTRLAAVTIARQHGLNPDRVVLVQQHPDAIDAGVFHNDVISVGYEQCLLCHEDAWFDQPKAMQGLIEACQNAKIDLHIHQVGAAAFAMHQAVSTYLFNSQIVTDAQGRSVLVLPTECERDQAVQACLSKWLARENGLAAIDEVAYVDVRQSMRNGGGPACLRLRMVMSEAEREASSLSWFTPGLEAQLINWVERHYRSSMTLDDLRDPQLLEENLDGLLALSSILGLNQTPWGEAIVEVANRWLS